MTSSVLIHTCFLIAIFAGPSFAYAAISPSQDVIVLATRPPQQNANFSEMYEETYANIPNFAISQTDPKLADLFGSNGVSNLCAPSALAQIFIQLFAYHQPSFSKLKLNGLSADGSALDTTQVVRQLFSLCHTDVNNGAPLDGQIQCVQSLLAASGYSTNSTKMITSKDVANAKNLPVVSRAPTLDDIRSFLRAGYGVKMGVGFYSFDEKSQSWIRSDGHAIALVGYGYNRSWGDSELVLKIVNTAANYSFNRNSLISDTVTLLKADHKSGVVYPPASAGYTLVGPGFTRYNFLEDILVFLP